MNYSQVKIKNIPFGVYTRIKRYADYYFNSLFNTKWSKPDLKATIIGEKYGGYIIPSFLNEKSVVYSFGIGEDLTFDLELIRQFNCKVVGFDPTPKSIEWTKNQDLPDKFQFLQFGLSAKSGKQTFFLPKNPNTVSASLTKDLGGEKIECDFLSFDDILKKLGHSYVDLVKMDVEGAEYGIFNDWISKKYTPPFGQIWVEFHPSRSGSTNFKTALLINKLKDISLIPAKSAVIYRTNHYLLINTKYIF
ncbi:MAG TPA: FkbM family methyltransferase [Mucilaginibacter sp.]|jgi:FkbM family methyltransferase